MPQLDAAREHRLGQLLLGLTEELRRGRQPDVDAVARQHPDLADELRQLWAAAQLVDHLARPSRPEGGRQKAEGSGEEADTAWLPTADCRLPTGPAALPRPFGDYDLLEELGRGGMGVVYKAWDRRLQRTVALKMVLRGDLASAVDLARFRAEALSAAGLAHENIVPVYAVSEHDGQAFFSMKYVEGTTLAARLAGGPLPPRQAARYLLAVARAVQHAHQRGILHRDLKPANVLLDGDDRPHVTDFGLAKRVAGGDRLTGTGAVVGTPSYMAPEQAAGSRGTLGPASDVYSLGAVLYELLTGRPPFQAASAVDTLFLVLEAEPVPPRALNPTVDRELESICLKCLQKPADLRYASAGELADDLRRFLNGEPTAARPRGLTPFLGRLFRETHHAAVLENWGVLWMWHSLQVLLLCAVTNVMLWRGVTSRLPYLALWSVGLVAWGSVFWALRRRGGPVTFVERQIAHVWAAGVAGSISVFVTEVLLTQGGLDLPVLALSPLLAVIAGMVFLVKAGMLSGTFYFAAAALFLTVVPMALFPSVAPLLFGLVSAGCFFFPGLKYHRQRRRSARPAR